MNYKELNFENKIPYPFINDYSYLDWFYTSHVLSFNMESQTQSNWCWAATSTSISKFYSFLSPWTQCKVATDELGNPCCTSPVPSACNIPWYLDRALDRTNNFVSIQSGTITWDNIKQELENGLVLGARIGWSGGGGHFMVIHGVTKSGGVEYLHIDDPIYGKSTLTYNQFATSYQNSGTWTHTYFTKKYFYIMWLKDLVFNPRLLRPISAVRPILNVYGEKIDQNKRFSDNDIGVPHFVYDIGLNEIENGMRLPENPSTLRVLDIKNEVPIAFYDLGLDEKRPELIQMNTNTMYFELLNRSIERLKEADSKNKGNGELRLIRIPALNLEALWLNYSGKTEDLICVLPRFDYSHIKCNTTYSPEEFTELIVKERKVLGDMDDTIGS